MTVDIAFENRSLGFKIEQLIREYESKTGMRVTNFKLKRDDWNNIEHVNVKAEFPEDD